MYYWEKSANKPLPGKEDTIKFEKIEITNEIESIIQKLKKKVFYNKNDLEKLNPDNPSIKLWIKKIFENLKKIEIEKNKINPQISDNILYLIDTYRTNLGTNSKEKEKYIIFIIIF